MHCSPSLNSLSKYTIKAAIIIFMIALSRPSKAQKIELLKINSHCSIRGVSIVNKKIAWISGSKGSVALSVDGNKTWQLLQVKGFEKSDFRSIKAFSAKQAIIVSAGTPAVILKTIDGGLTWQVKYNNIDKAYFFDAISFFNDLHGLILGDPINGKFILLETIDGGETWQPKENVPEASTGEACFAASGTCLRTLTKRNRIVIVTGGDISNQLTLNNDGIWHRERLPLAQGSNSRGAFSYAEGDGFHVYVGGDYVKNHNTDSVACYGKKSMSPQISMRPPTGYQSCVEYIGRKSFISTGTSGTHLSIDGGQTWIKIDNEIYNVCMKCKQRKMVLLAGDDGKIGLLKL